ncbi:GtrA family protein [Halosimplex halophilum]|uniref:GtrA family protein n=1 Tax=Halosimplex halophilum TaxID=2559572 RepID=UPI00107F042A|nr:GtrA family protein [Halosimplex halophilum]
MTDGERSARARLSSLVSGIRFGKFVSVGVVGALCDTAVLVFLSEVLKASATLAWAAGVETAILVMFLINENWTFADHGEGDRGSFLSRLKRSHAVRAVGVTTQFVIWWSIYNPLFVDLSFGDVAVLSNAAGVVGIASVLSGLDLWLLVAKGTGIAVGMLVNYVFESLFTWQVHEA